MRKPPMITEMVREFRTGLAGFVGRFVRVHTASGELREGILVSVPEVFVGVGEDGELIVRGNYVLGGPHSYVGKIEEIHTYDVLLHRSAPRKPKSSERKVRRGKKASVDSSSTPESA